MNEVHTVNRIEKIHRLVTILIDDLNVEDPADIAHWGDDEWLNLCEIDFEREQLKRLRPPSEETIAGTISALAAALDDSDPFEGLI